MVQTEALLEISGVTEQNLAFAAQQVVTSLPANVNVLCLEGEMGAGKTTLIKQICAELGVVDTVSSPTYALVNEYQAKGGKRICHFDFYRVKSQEEAAQIGITEYFSEADLCLVEWPSQIPDLLPLLYALLTIHVQPDQTRSLSLTLQSTS